ncbi:ADP-ribosylglycohydrolase family protein [Alkaliphilus peptidifermentans]|uniref:ADP-ribosylglycohydrolase n=1 Tax=Alkaliphilus peptidifermentans DSM 18978 TaxID=1120976 RepID=A0A1G5EBM3_9FIRM|nr:ADP-ribosylglycohydrolase family protein [Alkaliphilus peptidifermentans]SCY24337.1 ADP-ribosylglycohydrolase [Alkaliphilus peptidifermentans DSM 18978]
MRNKKDLFAASLLGGAIGDALGYTVEFMKLDEIKSKYGELGITDLEIDMVTGKALISDDTQMTLFTADGMMWAYHRCSRRGIGTYAGSGTYQSYLRWYYTQTRSMMGIVTLQVLFVEIFLGHVMALMPCLKNG